MIAEAQPSLVLVGATKTGMEVAPRIAERLGRCLWAWAVDIKFAGEAGGTTADCMLYAGPASRKVSVPAPADDTDRRRRDIRTPATTKVAPPG